MELAEISSADAAIMMRIRAAESAVNPTFGRACLLHAPPVLSQYSRSIFLYNAVNRVDICIGFLKFHVQFEVASKPFVLTNFVATLSPKRSIYSDSSNV